VERTAAALPRSTPGESSESPGTLPRSYSHADHIGDVPFIAKRFGSKIIGSRTTTNLMLAAGVDKSQVTTISGTEKFDFKWTVAGEP
jgi:hypothetical protein